MDYLALGDSYTIGEGVPEAGRWTVQLAAALRCEGIPVEDPRTIAATGWTTDELAAAMDAAEPLGRWDCASLLVGVNDQYRGRDLTAYRAGFHPLLERAIGLVGGHTPRVLVLSIPDWGATPFGAASGRDLAAVARELDAFNRCAADLCALHGVCFVDVTTLSRERGAAPGMLVEDGLHPSAAMYRLWAERALPFARRLLADVEK